MALGECCKSSVEFIFPNDSLAPLEEVVLHDAFVNLMEDIWGDASEDIGVREVSPEWMVYRAKTVFVELVWDLAVLHLRKDLDCVLVATQRVLVWISALFARDKTARASILLATRDEALFRMISHVRCQDGVYAPEEAVGARHQDAVLACINERVEHGCHAGVKQPIGCV